VLVGLLFAAALTVARAQEGVVSRVQAHAPRVKRYSGVVLIGVGVWFLALAVFADLFADLFPV
jgi:cytochrome c biogenesis protein CcdA